MWRGRERAGNGINDKDDSFFKSNAIDSVIDADATQSHMSKKEVKFHSKQIFLFVEMILWYILQTCRRKYTRNTNVKLSQRI